MEVTYNTDNSQAKPQQQKDKAMSDERYAVSGKGCLAVFCISSIISLGVVMVNGGVGQIPFISLTSLTFIVSTGAAVISGIGASALGLGVLIGKAIDKIGGAFELDENQNEHNNKAR